MRPLRALACAGAALASAALLLPVGPAGAAAPERARRSDTVVMTVESVTPSTPAAKQALEPLTVQLNLVNTTDKDLNGVRILGERGDTIGNQRALDRSLSAVAPPSSSGLPIRPTHPVTVDLPAGSRRTVTFATTTSISTDAGLCICHENLVYPLFFSAHVTAAGGVDQRLGVAATYVPAFDAAPAPVHVNWVWPLIDRPHRLLGDTVFSDDLLAGTVSSDGRLSRALDVVEQVADTVPLTLMIDPETLDELEVMKTGRYTVSAQGHNLPGAGQAAATDWLARLRAVLEAHPNVQVQLTPYADPDVQSLDDHGLSWETTMPADMSTRVSEALAGRSLDATVAWPAAGVLGAGTLKTLASTGVNTVILNSAAVTPAAAKDSVPAGLARLDAGQTDVAAALTSPAVEKYAARAVTLGGSGSAALPELVAELAVRAAQEPKTEHAAVITAPRYVDPSVAAAVRAITDTSRSTFSRPISLRSAVSGALLPTGRSRLATRAAATALSPATLATATHVGASLPGITAMLDQTDAGARALVASLPVAVQRTESSAWQAQPNAATGGDYTRLLSDKMDSITNGVHIVRPSSGAYTLGSSTSPIPITVNNQLAYPVTIRIQVTTVNGLPGFTAGDIGEQHVDSNQKRTLNVPTKTDRSGRIKVQAVLLTPTNLPLGDPVQLTVRSTALGVIGVVITIGAGIVLVFALLLRLGRRLYKRRAAVAVPDEPTPVPVDEPELAP